MLHHLLRTRLRQLPTGIAQQQRRQQRQTAKHPLIAPIVSQHCAAQYANRRADRHGDPHHREHPRQLITVEAIANRRLRPDRTDRRAKGGQHPRRQQHAEAAAEQCDDRSQQIERQPGQNGGTASDDVAHPPPNHHAQRKGEKVARERLRRHFRTYPETMRNVRQCRAVDGLHHLGKHHHRRRQCQSQLTLHNRSCSQE